MTKLAMSPCRRCRKAHGNRNGYCDVHQSLAIVWNKSRTNKSAERNGSTRAWRTLRRSVLLRDRYTCRVCGALGVNEVDHIKAKALGGTDDPDNLQAICCDCHKEKTVRESVEGRQLVLG